MLLVCWSIDVEMHHAVRESSVVTRMPGMLLDTISIVVLGSAPAWYIYSI